MFERPQLVLFWHLKIYGEELTSESLYFIHIISSETRHEREPFAPFLLCMRAWVRIKTALQKLLLKTIFCCYYLLLQTPSSIQEESCLFPYNKQNHDVCQCRQARLKERSVLSNRKVICTLQFKYFPHPLHSTDRVLMNISYSQGGIYPVFFELLYSML